MAYREKDTKNGQPSGLRQMSWVRRKTQKAWI